MIQNKKEGKIYRPYLWIQVFMPSIAIMPGCFFFIVVHFSDSLKDLSIEVLLVFFVILFALWMRHESNISITLYPNCIVYKKGFLPKKIISKENIISISRKSIKRIKGPESMIVIKLKDHRQIVIPPPMFRSDILEILKDYLSS